MLVGISIELSQPGFELLHQTSFLLPRSYLKHHSPNQTAGMARRPIQPDSYGIALCEASS